METKMWTRPPIHSYKDSQTHTHTCKRTFQYPIEGLQKTFLSYSHCGLSGCLKWWRLFLFKVKVFQVFESWPIFPLQPWTKRRVHAALKLHPCEINVITKAFLLWHFPKVKRREKSKRKGRPGKYSGIVKCLTLKNQGRLRHIIFLGEKVQNINTMATVWLSQRQREGEREKRKTVSERPWVLKRS